jgi:large conductance mechanosensitive channel
VLKGFKDFLLRGNVVDLAVAVVVGAAFTAVVTAFTDAFLKPLIQLFSGGGEFAGKIVVDDVQFDYATFINSVITFVLTAAVIYFLVVYPLKWLQERRRRGEDVGDSRPTDAEVLTEIRDLLRELVVVSGGAGPSATTTDAFPAHARHSVEPAGRRGR